MTDNLITLPGIPHRSPNHPALKGQQAVSDGTTRPDRDVDATGIEHIPLGDLIAAYRATGYRLILTLEDNRD